jgi:glyoxylase I family protein
MAFGARTREELQTIQGQLDRGGISHGGIKLWQDGVTDYIWLDDPDGMRVEFWLRPE